MKKKKTFSESIIICPKKLTLSDNDSILFFFSSTEKRIKSKMIVKTIRKNNEGKKG